ncbi:winged helix-turn-helix domain-containing protein [Dehalobacter sp. DCM]|uniref:BTAD domain-containing putative transcriptional regulator n=1 Tax=Dehalobacter sp. DCM TaxID=2907827 RepID=UPI003081417E|nr:winged helix-turn-helix domain-containing protein [Dehalobacter sp. DCM]
MIHAIETDQKPYKDDRIIIRTFGQFSVKRGGTVLSAESHKSQKMWDLFKYFITNRGKNIMPETIQETLWPDQDYEYSNKAFRTMIYRLRKELNKGEPDEADAKDNDSQLIIYSHGCYGWNPDANFQLDIDEFEKNYATAKMSNGSDLEKALSCYQSILAMYQGCYLSESMYTEWTIPLRNHYRRLYLQAMEDYCALLNDRGQVKAIIEVCEKVILNEPLEEEFHILLMEALLKEGKVKDARQNYEYITSKLYQELGVRPSAELKNLYNRITAKDKSARADIDSVQEEMTSSNDDSGPFFCDKETFKSIYDLERRRVERNGQSVFTVLLSLQLSGRAELDRSRADKAFAILKDILARSLRKGDVCAMWGELQYILILQGINAENTKMVVGRIEMAFRELTRQNEVVLRARYQPIVANQNISDYFNKE